MNTNESFYRFSDFTLENYRRLLRLAVSKGFVFSDYNTDSSMKATDKARTIVWRHDVEFSVQRAFKMAKVEAETGIKTHYFFQLHCEFYNIFEKNIYVLAKEIQALGHYVGLHFDAHFWGVKDKGHLQECLSIDKHILELLLDTKISSFSFHNTTPELLAHNDLYYADMLNVYGREIREKYRYCSDSTGFWRFERLEDVLQDDSIKYLQVLTHDGMWQDTPMAPRQRVLRSIEGRAQNLIAYYDRCLAELGQKNIDD